MPLQQRRLKGRRHCRSSTMTPIQRPTAPPPSAHPPTLSAHHTNTHTHSLTYTHPLATLPQAVAYEYNTEFSRVLQQRMEFFGSDPAADTLGRVRGEILQVKVRGCLGGGGGRCCVVNKLATLPLPVCPPRGRPQATA